MSALQPPVQDTGKSLQFICSKECVRKAINQLWFLQAWRENRNIFMVLIGDLFVYPGFLATIFLGHTMIEMLPLTESRRLLLEDIHFLSMVGVWGFISIALLTQAALAIYKGLKHSMQGGESTGLKDQGEKHG